jgi:PAS domain S-box-containing protein
MYLRHQFGLRKGGNDVTRQSIGTEKAIRGTGGSKERSDPLEEVNTERKVCVEAERGSWIFNAARDDLISILDNLPCGVAILRSPFGKTLYINDQIIATLGYPLSQTPSTRAMMKKAIPDRKARSEANKLWRERVRSREMGTVPVVREYLCADGLVRSFEHRAVVLRKDLLVNLWIDVTRREVAEAKLRESESRFRSFFENSSDPFLLLDGSLVVDCNLAAQQMFGCDDRERIAGCSVEDLSPERQPDGAPSSLRGRSLFKAALKRGRYRCEWTARRMDGKELPVEISITAITLDGKTLLFAVLRDITEWKKAQHALLGAKVDLEKIVRERTSDLAVLNKQLVKEIGSRKKTELEVRRSREELRNLSEYLQRMREEGRADVAREMHDELGQALSAVAIDLSCLRGRLPPGQDGFKEQVQEIEARIGDTMRSVREICRKLRPPILDDLGLATAIKWHLRQFQEKTGVHCFADVAEELPDHQKELDLVVFRIYQEAMTNVLRHAEATKVEVALKCNKTCFVLKVQDNGKGISAEQLASSLSLGILGIRERVRFWGGKSLLTGAPGKGTTVKVSIPFKQRKRSFKESALHPI